MCNPMERAESVRRTEWSSIGEHLRHSVDEGLTPVHRLSVHPEGGVWATRYLSISIMVTSTLKKIDYLCNRCHGKSTQNNDDSRFDFHRVRRPSRITHPIPNRPIAEKLVDWLICHEYENRGDERASEPVSKKPSYIHGLSYLEVP